MRNGSSYHVHIAPVHKLSFFDLSSLWQYRDLIVLITKRDFSLRYRQTVLGPLWLLINPLLTALIHVVLFNRIAKIGTDGVPALLFYLVSNGLWSYMASLLERVSNTFIGNANLFGKVFFPRLVMPLSSVMVCTVELVIKFLLIIALTVYYWLAGIFTVNLLTWLLIPVVLLWMSALGTGLGLIIASLTAKYRDLHVLISFGLTLWMYATPVVYPLSQIENPLYRTLLYLNPATAPMELFRSCVLGTGGVHHWTTAASLAMTAVFMAVGALLFNRVEKNFMDTV